MSRRQTIFLIRIKTRLLVIFGFLYFYHWFKVSFRIHSMMGRGKRDTNSEEVREEYVLLQLENVL